MRIATGYFRSSEWWRSKKALLTNAFEFWYKNLNCPADQTQLVMRSNAQSSGPVR
jgi:hypothetical protein